MKILVLVLVLQVITVVAWGVVSANRSRTAFLAEIVVLEAARDSALAAVDAAVARAEEAAARADELEALKEVEKAEAEARARWLATRADSLADAIGAMIPPGELQDAVTDAVARLRASYETRLADLEGIVGRVEDVNVTLRAELVQRRTVELGLRDALEATTEQRDEALAARNPGIWQRVKDAAAPAAVVGLACLVIGVVVAG